MKLKKPTLNKNHKIIFALVLSVLLALALIKYPTLSSEGIVKGLGLSAGTMVPSLFPFIVVSSFAANSGAVNFLGRKTDKFFRKIWGLSGTAGSIILFGLFGGFPVGCSMAANLYSRNKITSSEAKRIALSSVNAGPAFVIGAVGTMMLSSFKAGVIIFVSLSVSSLTIAFFSKWVLPSDGENRIAEEAEMSLSDALVTSVYSSSKTMLLICAWILIFSCFINILTGTVDNESLTGIIKIFAEVSQGCEKISETKNPAHLAFVIGWSGLCVHCQILPHVIKTGLKIKYFLCSRIFHACLSSLICAGLLSLFPCEISVFSSGTSAILRTFAVSAPAAAGLLLMCAIFILDLDTHRKMC